jgi:hypothetical protein
MRFNYMGQEKKIYQNLLVTKLFAALQLKGVYLSVKTMNCLHLQHTSQAASSFSMNLKNAHTGLAREVMDTAT